MEVPCVDVVPGELSDLTGDRLEDQTRPVSPSSTAEQVYAVLIQSFFLSLIVKSSGR